MVMGSEMIDLGMVIKAQAVIDVINAYLGKSVRNSARTDFPYRRVKQLVAI